MKKITDYILYALEKKLFYSKYFISNLYTLHVYSSKKVFLKT